MLIKIVSDLHQEFHTKQVDIPATEQDKDITLIIAGDLDVKRSSSGYKPLVDALHRFSEQYKYVIFVLGNHEYWNSALYSAVDSVKSLISKENVYVLENESIVLDGVMFFGATFWTEFTVDPMFEWELNSRWNDFKKIKDSTYRTIQAKDLRDIHLESVNTLKDVLKQPFEGKTVVVTHHLPCMKSVAPRFMDDPFNCCFVSDQLELIQAFPIDLWVHGHTHTSFDYTVAGTRIICNPYGYKAYEENVEFDFNKIIDTDTLMEE